VLQLRPFKVKKFIARAVALPKAGKHGKGVAFAIARVAASAGGSYKHGPQAFFRSKNLVVKGYIACYKSFGLLAAKPAHRAIKYLVVQRGGGHYLLAGGQKHYCRQQYYKYTINFSHLLQNITTNLQIILGISNTKFRLV
jgi:hypothetical protein